MTPVGTERSQIPQIAPKKLGESAKGPFNWGSGAEVQKKSPAPVHDFFAPVQTSFAPVEETFSALLHQSWRVPNPPGANPLVAERAP